MLQKVGHNIINYHDTTPRPCNHPETTHQGVIIHPRLNNHAGGIKDSFCEVSNVILLVEIFVEYADCLMEIFLFWYNTRNCLSRNGTLFNN